MRIRSAGLALVTGSFAILLVAAPVLATLESVSAYAYGESVNVSVLNQIVNITSGPIPETAHIGPGSGSSSPGTLASVCVPGPLDCSLLDADTLVVTAQGTTGSSGTVHSTASVQNVTALDGIVVGTVIASECSVDSTGQTSGFTTLTNVTVGGVPVAVNPPANTTITIGTTQVILNEQTYNGTTNTLTVNAIHIVLGGTLTVGGLTLTGGDIIISHVECDALPAGNPPVIPESPLAILLPISALAVGGILLVTIRRRTAFEQG